MDTHPSLPLANGLPLARHKGRPELAIRVMAHGGERISSAQTFHQFVSFWAFASPSFPGVLTQPNGMDLGLLRRIALGATFEWSSQAESARMRRIRANKKASTAIVAGRKLGK